MTYKFIQLSILLLLFDFKDGHAQNHYVEVFDDAACDIGIDKDISNILKKVDFKKYPKVAFTFYPNYPDCHDSTEFWKETLTYTKETDSVLILHYENGDNKLQNNYKKYFLWKEEAYFECDSTGKLERNAKVRVESLKDSLTILIITETANFSNYYNKQMTDTNITKETFDKQGKLIETSYNEVWRGAALLDVYNYFGDTLTTIKYFEIKDGIKTNSMEKQIRTYPLILKNKTILTETIHDIFTGFPNLSKNGNKEEYERQIRTYTYDSIGRIIKVELSKAEVVKGEWTRPWHEAEIAIDVKYYN